MNVKITKAEPRWDYKTGTCEDYKVTLIGNGLSKTEVKSLVRFSLAGMTSKSVHCWGIRELTSIVNEAEENGSWHSDDDSFIVEVENEA